MFCAVFETAEPLSGPGASGTTLAKLPRRRLWPEAIRRTDDIVVSGSMTSHLKK